MRVTPESATLWLGSPGPEDFILYQDYRDEERSGKKKTPTAHIGEDQRGFRGEPANAL